MQASKDASLKLAPDLSNVSVELQGAGSKIRSLEDLAVVASALRREGRTVALCHGVFDLIHLGHVRHIEAARREADVLMVTVTADKFVNKGPGRPAFPDVMRAEMLASLACVDWVGINHGPSAEPLIELIKPDAYVKGSEYENPDDDITGKIASERAAVERHGGRVVFTRDITFSSSSLINRYLDVFDPKLKEHLDIVRAGDGAARILALIESVNDMHVVLVGDTIIDEYQYVSGLGKASKENIVATQFKGKELFAGGVVAAANHVANFCKSVEVVTLLGNDDSYEDVVRQSLKPNVQLNAVHIEGRPTTRKLRFVETGYLHKLFEVYFMDDLPLSEADRVRVDTLVNARAGAGDLVIATDFGHGLIARSTIDILGARARFLAVNAQTNSGNHGYNLITKYKRADYVCIDAPEARLAAADKYSDIRDVIERGLSAIECDRMVVTHGAFGCYPFERGRGVSHVPAFTKTVVDTVGAGDAFLAITSPMAAIGGAIDDVAFIGNAAGAIKVGIVGHRASVDKVSLVKFVTALLK